MLITITHCALSRALTLCIRDMHERQKHIKVVKLANNNEHVLPMHLKGFLIFFRMFVSKYYTCGITE